MNTCPATSLLESAFTALLHDGVEDPAIVAHVEVCGRCQSWLESMLAGDAGGPVRTQLDDGGWADRRSREEQTTDFRQSLVSSPPFVAASLTEAMPLPTIAGYEILSRLGKGGMGVVYKARQKKLNRVVALKMILAGEHADADKLTRFHREAKAVGRLSHPHIVQIYDVGLAKNLPYFVLEYLPGGSLKELLQRGGPLAPQSSAALLATLAQAVHAAHLAGIVHRDLKPTNVLLAEDGTAKITDFGLAKRLEMPEQTQTGQILGTPEYMAPEQARGESKSVGPEADVYALGAVLYETLTGRPPFQGMEVMEILHKVQNEEPVPPRRLAAGVPADLETICLKALRKEVKDRYATAQEFADELDRFLHDEPVRARPLSRLEKVCRWCRREPTLAGLLASVTGLMLMAGLAILMGFYQVRLRQEHAQTEKALAGEKDARRKERRYMYVNDIYMADRLYHENQLFRTRQLLEDCAEDQRGWEWNYLDRITSSDLLSMTGHTQPVHALALTPRRRWLVSGSGDGSLVFWEPSTARRLLDLPGDAGPIWGAAFSADGTRLASTAAPEREPGKLIVWELGDGSEPKPRQMLRTSLGNQLGEHAAVGYHPSKPLLAVATGMRKAQPGCLLLLDAHGQEIRRWSGSAGGGCVALAWSPDGRRLAASFTSSRQTAAKGEVVILDPDLPQPLFRIEANGGVTTALAFGPDGRTLACGGEDRTIELRDAGNFTLRKMCYGHNGPVTSLAFTRDGHLVSGGKDTTVRVWDQGSGQEFFVRRGHYGPVRCLAIQPENGPIYSGSDDITIKAWRAEASQESQTYPLHQGAASAVAFSPDGTALISVGWDGAVWRIDPTGAQRPRLLLQERRPLRQVRFLPQSHTILAAGGEDKPGLEDGTIRLLDAGDGRLSGELDTQLALVSSLSLSGDGLRLSVVGRTRQHQAAVQIWDLTARPPRCDAIPPDRLPGEAIAAQLYSGGDKLLVLLSQVNNFLKPSYVLLDLSKDAALLPGTRHPIGNPRFAVFNKDESMLFLGGRDQGFNKFRVGRSGLIHLARYCGHAAAIRNGALSPDERLFATASEDETIRLWDGETDRELLVLRGDASSMNDVAFSPTGGFLAAAQSSGAVRVWNGGPRPAADRPSVLSR
jgi:serine/threonine protein kinase/WD40 repeat protein